MTRDWTRLASAIEGRRREIGFTQVDLAEAAGVSESTVQNLESGVARRRLPSSLPRIEIALGWETGSGEAVLDGAEPTVKPQPETPQAGQPAALPLRIQQELEDGQLLDATVLDLTPDSSAKMIVVVKGETGATPEQVRRDLLAWADKQRRLQG
ncbi:helix-turn-helix domain-containing protein [Streptomyces albidoflavus]|uniref:helix-turn-helix domain-containing protein n=1 Tax=Streptomyces albidoflavus TaxID=1886 RepID=UPI00344BA633